MADQAAEVKAKTDIVSVISAYVELKKAGRHFMGRCPFHSEKTPSFTVSPELQIYKCFGCGEGGDVYDFLQKYEGISFFESLKVLAEKAGVVLNLTTSPKDGIKSQLLLANESAASFYHYLLTKHPIGAAGLEYLVKERGLNHKTIEEFKIGFAPNTPSDLSRFLTTKKSFNQQILIDAGLCFRNDRGKLIDRFRGRIIFPLTNPRGGTIALAGRILPKLAREGVPKYINSPETEVYHKSEALFGFYQARDHIKKEGFALVVEGELDMISPYQAGFRNVVAIKGSSLTSSHADFLSRFTNSVYLGLDSDFAGNTAAIKGVVISENKGLIVKVVEFTGFKDPDEAARDDIDNFKKTVSLARPFWDFLFDVYTKRYDPKTSDGAAIIVRALVPYLSEISEPVIRSRYARKLAELVDSSEESVMASISSQKQEEHAPQKQVREQGQTAEIEKTESQPKDKKSLLLAQLFATGIISAPHELTESVKNGIALSRPYDKIVGHLEEYLTTHAAYSAKEFIDSLPSELKSSATAAVLTTQLSDEASQEFKKIIRELERIALFDSRSELFAKMKSFDKEDESAEFTALQKEIGELTKRIALLDK